MAIYGTEAGIRIVRTRREISSLVLPGRLNLRLSRCYDDLDQPASLMLQVPVQIQLTWSAASSSERLAAPAWTPFRKLCCSVERAVGDPGRPLENLDSCSGKLALFRRWVNTDGRFCAALLGFILPYGQSKRWFAYAQESWHSTGFRRLDQHK